MIQYELQSQRTKRGRGFHNPDCRESLARYFCFVNFPRCDESLDLSLPTCRSVCENFMRSCGYESQIWKCHDSRSSSSSSRVFSPGQPFVDGTSSRSSVAVCTPSIRGNASLIPMSWGVWIGLVFLSMLFLL